MQEINNIIPEYTNSNIHQAAEKGDIETVRSLLLNSDINANKKNYYNFTPLHLAVQKGHIEVVKLLLNVPDINVNRKCSLNCVNPHFISSRPLLYRGKRCPAEIWSVPSFSSA